MRKAGGQIASLMNDKSGGRVLCPLATSAEWEDDRFVQALTELEPLIGLGILGLSRANTVCVGAHAAI